MCLSMCQAVSPRPKHEHMQSKDLSECWSRTNTTCSSSVKSQLKGLQLIGSLSLISQLACGQYRQSQIQQCKFKKIIQNEHPGWFMKAWIICSMMTVNLKFYCTGVPALTLHGILATTFQEKQFPDVLLVCVRQC